jgi:hypothetical protein
MRIVQSTALAMLCGAGALTAQTTDSVRLTLMPGSELTFTGTSTLHGFTCQTKDIQAFIYVVSSYTTMNLPIVEHPILGVRIVIPVKSLACGGELEGNMRKALKADKYPTITYVLSTYHGLADSTSANHFVASMVGMLTIAGTTDSITMNVDTDRDTSGTVTAQGGHSIQMTDFHIKPPTFMLMLHTGNTIKVRFTLKATARAVQAARDALAPSTALVTRQSRQPGTQP